MTLGKSLEGITLFISMGFLFSLFYNAGFSYAFDFRTWEFPISVSDHFNTGTLWFPELVWLLLIAAVFHFTLAKIEKGRTPDELIESSPAPKFMRKFWSGSMVAGLIGLISPVAAFLFLGDVVAPIMPFAVFVAWFAFSTWSLSEPLIQNRYKYEIKLAYQLVPAFLGAAFFFGYKSAVESYILDPSFVAIEIFESKTESRVRLIRSLEDGIVFLDDNNAITFIPWPKIKMIKRHEAHRPFSGIDPMVSEFYKKYTGAFKE